MARTVLPVLDVDTGIEVDQLRLHPDGTIEAEGDAAAGILRTRVREFDETEAEAFAALDRHGWTNAYLVITPEE